MFILDQPTYLAVKSISFDGLKPKTNTIWEKRSKLLQIAPGSPLVGRDGLSFTYLDTDFPVAGVKVAIASEVNGWQVSADVPPGPPPVTPLAILAGSLPIATCSTADGLRRRYQLDRPAPINNASSQLEVVAELEADVGQTTFRKTVRVCLPSDSVTTHAFEDLFASTTNHVDALRNASMFALLWRGKRAVIISVPALERACLGALLSRLQDQLLGIGSPAPTVSLRDIERLLSDVAVADSLIAAPAIKKTFRGPEASVPSQLRTQLQGLAKAYGGVIVRTSVVVGATTWTVYYDRLTRKAVVLPTDVQWTVTKRNLAAEITHLDRLSVFYLELEGRTAPAQTQSRDREFQTALSTALNIPDLPAVHFQYGLVGAMRAALVGQDPHLSTLKVGDASKVADVDSTDSRMRLTLMIDRPERDYLREVSLKTTSLPFQLSWDGKAFTLDRLTDHIDLPGRLRLAADAKVPLIVPQTSKLAVLVFGGPMFWKRRQGDAADVEVRYQGQHKTASLKRDNQTVADPLMFDTVFDDSGKVPIVRLEYRSASEDVWTAGEVPLVLLR
jgi:hypothetical protein